MVEDLFRATTLAGQPSPIPLSVRYSGPWHPAQGAIPPGMPLSIDLETIPNTATITQLNWAVRACEAYSGPWTPAAKAALQEAMQAGRLLIFHNAQFDVWHLLENGLSVPGPYYDTMIATAILEPDLPNSLEHVAKDYTDIFPWKHIRSAEPWKYGCIDADATLRVKQETEKSLKAEGVWGVFQTSMQVQQSLIEMWRTGLRLDLRRMEELQGVCQKQEAEAQAKLDEMARALPARSEQRTALLRGAEEAAGIASTLRNTGAKGEARKKETEARHLQKAADALWNVKWNSPKQLLEVLDQLGLDRKFDHKTGRVTTDASAIQELARTSGNPLLLELLRYREHQKLRSTFLTHDAAYLHPQYLLHRDYDLEGALEGACSGRLASKDPNIQNWPHFARQIVVPDEDGWEWLEADYGQIEARIVAWFAGGALWRGFNTEGFDIHRFVAGRALGIPPEMVTSDQRDRGKRVVYAAVYGVGPITLSRRLMADGIHMPVAECKRFINAFHDSFPEVKRAQRRFLAQAFETNKVTNPFGRYRRFYAPNAESTAIYNIYPQSTAGDIILRAMAGLRTQLPRPARLAVQVHDSLLIGYPREMRARVQECVADCMVFPIVEMPGFSVPVTFKRGENWGDGGAENPKGMVKVA